MGERGEVAGGADRSLGRDSGIDLGVEQRQERLDDRPPDAGMAEAMPPL